LHLARGVVLAVNELRPQRELGERQIVERPDLGDRVVVSDQERVR
jgi:hypothetical protein